jgi:hypothetical protein
VRTMGCIRVDKITEYLCDPLQRCLKASGSSSCCSGGVLATAAVVQPQCYAAAVLAEHCKQLCYLFGSGLHAACDTVEWQVLPAVA